MGMELHSDVWQISTTYILELDLPQTALQGTYLQPQTKSTPALDRHIRMK